MKKESDSKETTSKREDYLKYSEPTPSDVEAEKRLDAWVKKQSWYKRK